MGKSTKMSKPPDWRVNAKSAQIEAKVTPTGSTSRKGLRGGATTQGKTHLGDDFMVGQGGSGSGCNLQTIAQSRVGHKGK